MRTLSWTQGNAVRLLENGEEYYPAVHAAIDAARSEILIETFILFEDRVGVPLKDALVRAARRGVRVTVTVDDYGSPSFSEAFMREIADAGIQLFVFDPRPRAFGMRTNLFRRLHRKIVVVDREIGFIGGLNFSADHLADFGPAAKQDYAVELRGPIVAHLHHALRTTLGPLGESRHASRRRLERARASAQERRARAAEPPIAPVGDAEVALVLRDNGQHRTDIETQYRMAIRLAREEIIIANAYFLPGYRFLRDLRRAAKRGVKVRLLLQGEPDMPWVRASSTVLYDYLIGAGVEIHEYCERPLHGKVAVVDGRWSTVGSSNLDPLSLSLNLEANVIINDATFARHLRSRLVELMENHCQLVPPSGSPVARYWRLALGWLMFHFLRRFPAWAGWLPAHRPSLRPADQLHLPDGAAVVEEDNRARPDQARSARAEAAMNFLKRYFLVLRRAWPRLRKPVAVLFFLLVAGLIVWEAVHVDWSEVHDALRQLGWRAVVPAILLTCASYLLYVSFDLLARRYTRHRLPRRRVIGVTFVSYAFNLNFGALIGGMAFRFRLYSQLGLRAGIISQVVAFSIFTNWLGYIGMTGMVLLLGFVTLPGDWVPAGMLRVVGAVLLALFVAYLALVLFTPNRTISWRDYSVRLPGFRMSLLQAALSMIHWATVAAVIYSLIPSDQVSYTDVLGAFLLSAIAVVISHVPAGLGVTEAVFLAVLGSSVGRGELLAALVAFRLVHYLAPLAVAGVVYVIMEALARGRDRPRWSAVAAGPLAKR